MERKAIALMSGGLDSVLAVRLILEQGIKVTAIKFLTQFGCDAIGSGGCGHDMSGLSKEMGFELKHCHLGEEYVKMVKNPKYGWGKNMNPCVDCRIMMLRWAKEYLEIEKASFIITGEVLGQRPMSQRRDAFRAIDRDSGLEGLLLRPLSAKLLPETLAEKEGIVDRERLMDISGRSRKPQYQLAEQFGITDFGQPAGGCLLTDESYSKRLRDLFDHTDLPTSNEINLLRVGRQFRFNENCKIIVGRNYQENVTIEDLAVDTDVRLEPVDFKGPVALISGEVAEEDIRIAAQLTVRYGGIDEGGTGTVDVITRKDGEESRRPLVAKAADDSFLNSRIGVKSIAVSL